MQKSFFFIIVLSLLTNCDNGGSGSSLQFILSPADKFDDVEYKVYAQVLKEKQLNTSNTKSILIIQQRTSKGNFNIDSASVQSLKKTYADFDVILPVTYSLANAIDYNLDNKIMVIGKSVELISKERLNFIFRGKDLNKNWENFYQAFPSSNGYINFSKIGFSEDKNQAVVAVGFYYGSLGADGILLYLRKDSNGWKVVTEISHWVS